MDMTAVYAVGAAICLGVGASIAFYRYKKKSVENLFTQTYEMARQVPKQKKNSFLLLMFKESLAASKKKKSEQASFASKFNNPKYLEVQLLHMANVLKDTSKVQDKNMKRALALFNDYQKWEKAKFAKEKQEVPGKAS